MHVSRIIHYRVATGEIVGKVEALYYIGSPISDEPDTDWIEYFGDVEWHSITAATHKVDLTTFTVRPLA